MKKHHAGRIAAAVSAFALTATGLGGFSLETKAESLMGLSAQDITSQMVIGWNLGNTLDCSGTSLSSTTKPEKFVTKWGNPAPTQELFQAVHDAGFNTVRIPTTWYEHLEYDEESQLYIINDTWMDYVKQTVDYAYDLGMFVILNVHHENWVNVSTFTDDTYAAAEKKLANIWEQVAETFSDYDQHLIFEGMNEPRQTGNPNVSEWGNGTEDDGYTTQYINNLNAVFVNTVRGQGSEANQERLLMLPGYCASADFTAVRNIAVPENAGNVALSVHAYAPYYFTMASDDKANHEFPGKSGWGEDYEGALTNLFNGLKTISEEKNAPIIIGEFSASNFDNTDSRTAWATDYLTKAKSAGIPCVLWDNNNITDTKGEAHGYLYRLTNTWYDVSLPVLEAMMNVYGVESDLPPYQEYVEPEFDWSNVNIGENWVTLFRPDEPATYAAWKNGSIDGWKDYLNENYDFVLVSKSNAEPYLVLQGSGKSWNAIYATGESDNDYVLRFTYDDFVEGVTKKGETVDAMKNLYISAGSDALTAYGLFAVPKNGTGALAEGDINEDGVVSVVDVVALQKFLLGIESDLTVSDYNADLNHDGIVNIYDLILLKKLVINAR